MNQDELKLAYYQRKLDKVEEAASARDHELAHFYEDEFYYEVLRWMAADAPEPYGAAARLAVKSKEIDFGRWLP